MKKIVFYASGENAGTYSPLCFLEHFEGDLNKVTQKFVSHDCDIYIEVKEYEVREISIPEWMDERYYLENHIAYKYAVALGGDYAKNLKRVGMNNFMKLPSEYQYFIGIYMSGKTKNNFKLSIREQIENWLNTEQPKYEYPLSESQFYIASRYVALYKAKQIVDEIYWNR